MNEYNLFLLLPIVLLAYFCKASTGFGAALVTISLGALVIGPVEALVVTAFLDMAGGLTLLRIDKTEDTRAMWLPLSIAMVCGTVVGAVILRFIALPRLTTVLAISLVVVGIWLIFVRARQISGAVQSSVPEGYRAQDLAVCFGSGITGGVTGLSGPPLVYFFGRRLSKEPLRRILTRIFLAEAIVRGVMYSAIGLVSVKVLFIGLLGVPTMFIGIYLGNHAFFRIPEKWFSRAAGLMVIASAAKLMF